MAGRRLREWWARMFGKHGSRLASLKTTIPPAPPIDLEELRKQSGLSEDERRVRLLLVNVQNLFARRSFPSKAILNAAVLQREGLVGAGEVSAEQAFRELRSLLLAGAEYRKGTRLLAVSRVSSAPHCVPAGRWNVLWECAEDGDQIKLSIMSRRRFRLLELLLPLFGWDRTAWGRERRRYWRL